MTKYPTTMALVQTLACLSLLVLGGSATAGAAATDDVLHEYIEVWNSGNVEALEALVTPDVERHAGPDESVSSLAELTTLITQTRSLYDRVRISIDDQTVAGGRGAYRGSFHGVHRLTRGIISFPVMGMVRFVDGRIAEEWIIGDNFLSLMALGYELVPPGFEAVPPPKASETNPGATDGP